MHRFIRKIMCLLLAAMMLALVPGCGALEETGDASGEEEASTIEIGMCFDSFVIERWQRDRDIFVQAAKDLGAEVNVQSANGDIEEQKKQIKYLIQKKVDVIVIVCIDSDSLAESVAEPEEGEMRPRRVRMVVDLPAPLGPMKPKHSPSSTVRFRLMIPRALP